MSFLSEGNEILPYEDFLQKYPERTTKLRFRLFAAKGLACIRCGLLGTHVVIWRHSNQKDGFWHNDLAAYKDSKLVMMTMDHRIPKSRGGLKTLENLDPMCDYCNRMKGQSMTKDQIIEHVENFLLAMAKLAESKGIVFRSEDNASGGVLVVDGIQIPWGFETSGLDIHLSNDYNAPDNSGLKSHRPCAEWHLVRWGDRQ